MVSLKDVSKDYTNQIQVLRNVNLQVARSEFLYIMGGSGAGKSTLLRLIGTQEIPSQGSVSLFGYDTSRVSSLTLRAIRQSIGYIPQGLDLIPDLSVYDNVSLSLSFASAKVKSSISKTAIFEHLERFGLAEKRNTRVSLLSGGEAQRVAFVRALAREPELIIADEPTGAQDFEHTWQMMNLFSKANTKGAAVIVATHDREIVKRMQKRCVILREGQIENQTSSIYREHP
jgi:cell division transport system ATP-binding protein